MRRGFVGLFKLIWFGSYAAITFLPLPVSAFGNVADEFRRVVARIDEQCRRDKSGPYLDANDPEYRDKRADTSCDILKLRPRDWRDARLVKLDSQSYLVPEEWLSTEEGRFAHSIELPLPGRPKTIKKAWTTPDQYFESLCREDAGEFILRTVSGVRGIRQDRSWLPMPNGYRDIVFWTREKGGFQDTDEYLVQPPLGRYQFVEVRLPAHERAKSGAPFRIFYRDESKAEKREITANIGGGRFARFPWVVAKGLRQESEASYAFTWRGLWPPDGLEHGIEGFELIIYQVSPLQVIAYQRDFWRHLPYSGQRDPRLTYTKACSQVRPMAPPHEFIQKVLVPADHP